MSDLIAIDPSIVSPGVAVFRNGILIANACIKVKPQDVNEGTRAQIAADAVCLWLHEQSQRLRIAFKDLSIAYEWPQIYQEDGPAVANAVISMAAVDAAVTMACRMRYGLQMVHSYKPAEVWGQLPKSKSGSYWKCPRGARIKSRLSELELTIAVDQHDAGDAVGLGLHSLGRLGLRRVFSNS
jgi:hypothetical protein